MKFIILLLIPFSVIAGGNTTNNYYTDTTGTTGTSGTNTITRTDGSYGNLGLMALAGNGLVFDWGVPEELQWSVSGSFISGGHQALAGGLATRVGAILFSAQFTTTIDGYDNGEDSAFIISGSGRF